MADIILPFNELAAMGRWGGIKTDRWQTLLYKNTASTETTSPVWKNGIGILGLGYE